MAAVNTVSSFVTVLGPKKMEVASLSSVDTTDTYTSTIVNPQFGFFVQNTASGAMTSSPVLTFSGRTVTLTSADLVNSTGVLVLFGF